MTKAKTKLWGHFSLYSAFCLLMIISGCEVSSGLSDYEKFQRKEDTFRGAIKAAGGSAVKENRSMFGFNRMGWIIDLTGAKVTDQLMTQIIEVGKFDPIFRMNFSKSKITNEQLAKLDGAKALEKTVELDLSNTTITDAGLDRLSNLCWISVLNLKGSNATKAGGEKLGEKKLANPDTPIPFKTQPEIEI